MAEASWFGGRLRELREQAGLTQQGLADKAGVSLRGVAQWEQGIREPGWSNVLALAQALGVSCDSFAVQPASATAPTVGRPRKSPGEGASLPPKRPRGRPRKSGG